jgi:hypothetical protein
MSKVDLLVQENEHIDKTLRLFNDIFKVAKTDEFKKFDEDDRHQMLIARYKELSNMYPVVVRLMARNLRYNEIALKKMLEKMRDERVELQKKRESEMKLFKVKKDKKRDPVKSMTKFVEAQADYAKFLYIEENKANGKRYNMKDASSIWHGEYNSMIGYFKKIRDQEEKNKNEFEDEKKKNLELRKQELLDFILQQQDKDIDFVEPPEEENDYNRAYLHTLQQRETAEQTDQPRELETGIAAPDVSDMVDMEFDKEHFDSYVDELMHCRESFDKIGDVKLKLTEHQISDYSDEIIGRLQAIENAINDKLITEEDYRTHIDDAKYCIQLLNDAVDIINTVNAAPLEAEVDPDWLVGTSAQPKRSGNGNKRGKGKKRVQKIEVKKLNR